MSFNKPLEPHKEPCESSYFQDKKTRIYYFDIIVKDRIHEKHGYQYAIRYTNGVHQWWNESDVRKECPHLLTKYLDKKFESKTSAKTQIQVSPNKASSSLSTISAQQSTGNKETRPRRRKRGSSQADDLSSGSEPMAVIEVGGEDIPSITSVKSLQGSSKKPRPMQKAIKAVETKTLELDESSSGNSTCEDKRVIPENVVDIQKSLSQQQQTNNSETETDFEKMEKCLARQVEINPFSVLAYALKKASEISDNHIGPGLEARKADQEELQQLKLSYEKILQENENLKDKMEKLRQQYEEQLEDKDKKLINLDTEIERRNTEHLKTLREIVGKGNYKNTDDEGKLKRIALGRAQKLNMITGIVHPQLVDVEEQETMKLEPEEEPQDEDVLVDV